jgi:hypothetical protein
MVFGATGAKSFRPPQLLNCDCGTADIVAGSHTSYNWGIRISSLFLSYFFNVIRHLSFKSAYLVLIFIEGNSYHVPLQMFAILAARTDIPSILCYGMAKRGLKQGKGF